MVLPKLASNSIILVILLLARLHGLGSLLHTSNQARVCSVMVW